MDSRYAPVHQPVPPYIPSVTPIEPPPYEATVSYQAQNTLQLPDNIELESTLKGVSSTDPSLSSDVNLLSLFFQSTNTSPRMWVDILGYEMVEKHIVAASSTSQMSRSRREERRIHFRLSYDVSQFISQTGTIHTPVPKKGPPKRVEDVLAEHISANNTLKKITLKKEVVWDYEWLNQALKSAIRSRGFRHRLQISYRLENYRVKVTSDRNTSPFLNHPATKVVCVITCLCVVAWPIAYLYSRKHQRKLISTFAMNLAPQEWFNAIYASLMNAPLHRSLRYS